jgi:hypothetical protein
MLQSLHDNLIVGYEVDCEARTIKVKTRRSDWAGDKRLRNVNFRGVVGYHFRDDAFSNIILAFSIVPIDKFVLEHGAEMAESFRNSGALDAWAKNCDTAITALRDANLTAVVITSSMGLSGWVLANDVEVMLDALN